MRGRPGFTLGGPLRPASGLAWPLLIGAATAIPRLMRPATLADPATCPGIVETALTLLLRGWPSLSVGQALQWLDAAAVFLALVCFARLVQQTTGSLLATATITGALSLSPFFDRSLAPATGALLFSAAGCAWLPVLAGSSHRRQSVALAGCAILALASPPLCSAAVLFAAAVVVSGGASARQTAATAAVLGAILVLTLFAISRQESDGVAGLPVMRTCASPLAPGSGRSVEAGGSELLGAGPYLLGLAAFGVFSWLSGTLPARQSATRATAVAAFAGSALGVSALSAPGSHFVWMSGWIFAGIGLAEILALGRGPARRGVTVALALLLILLQAQRWHQRGAPATDHGHARLSSAELLRLTGSIPEVTLVSEDASSVLVFRAAAARLHRLGKRPRIVAANRDDIAAAAANQFSPVVALPRAQLALQQHGVQFRPMSPDSPLAAVASVHACEPVLDGWHDAAALRQSTRFTLVARRDEARGPIAVYLGTEQPLQVQPVTWPGPATRGFVMTRYAREAQPDLAEALRAQGIPVDNRLLASAHVVRLVLWRTPGAPRVLTVALGQPPQAAVARVDQAAEPGSIELCPSFDYRPHPFR